MRPTYHRISCRKEDFQVSNRDAQYCLSREGGEVLMLFDELLGNKLTMMNMFEIFWINKILKVSFKISIHESSTHPPNKI